MKELADESAELKQALKHDPETTFLASEADSYPLEASEAMQECLDGLDVAAPGSWVFNRLAE